MKRIKSSILSTLALVCMCLVIFTDRAYADVASPLAPLKFTWVMGLGLIVLIVLFISMVLIRRIRDKKDNNKFN